MVNALRALFQQKALIATLNYDTVAANAIDSVPITLSETDSVLAWCRKEREGILHLHGVWTKPDTCVFGIRDYDRTLTDEVRGLLQKSLSSLNRLLFIGCGDTLADPNFSTLIDWLRENVGAGAPQHYAFVRSDEVASRMVDPAWKGFVEPISYGDSHADLPSFLLTSFPTRPVKKVRSNRSSHSVDRHQSIISSYKAFILRDCGEMTIEGMRADMDTAQRKFDLEKLFVPLDVQSIPPVIAITDENRDTKLRLWREKYGEPIRFASAFAKNKKIALLALPGGGKTLLLKRLAVAYCDQRRREASSDDLPTFEIVPIMLRCREWKEHIRKPFGTLLKEISSITGDQTLIGLAEALEKPLKAGSVLLLVDGLDEIHDDGDRTIFVENLEKFIDDYPKIRLLVTSREAGFDLVAPCVARFCTKLKIAPLNSEAIRALSGHWHQLMSGAISTAQAEAASVANMLLAREPLRRLAENPLLLTMLLVVKHGAGRLPPDRVSLYDRAVEVLLDTWNIKGHEALNTKEAVPQLACLAFELMRRGSQTATEREILEILNEARAQLPTIGRYAKDSPHEFLKRVELRSSLMLEGGHTSEGGRTVPFYQFRHLTFQEYLAAVAAAGGYILDEALRQSPLAAIDKNLLADEWKEVVPMAAVLARNQAGPILDELTTAAEKEASADPNNKNALASYQLPPATGRLAQAMIEEADFPPDILRRAARLVTYFSDGLRSQDNYKVLSQGPYGADLRSAAFQNYITGNHITRSAARNTLAALEGYAKGGDYWLSEVSIEDLAVGLTSSDQEEQIRAIAATGGSFVAHQRASAAAQSTEILGMLERTMFHEDPLTYLIGAWSWGFWRHLHFPEQSKPYIPESETIHRLAHLFIKGFRRADDTISFLIANLPDVGRSQCVLRLTKSHLDEFRSIYDDFISSGSKTGRYEDRLAILRIAYLLPSYYSDEELRGLLDVSKRRSPYEWAAEDIYAYLGMDLPKSQVVAARKRMKVRSGSPV